jgi:Family of unknown function (DUF6476)
MSDMAPAPQDPATLPPELRFLKWLVTALAGTMIIGLITIVALFVTRLPKAPPARAALPESLQMPDGLSAEAITMGRGWVGVVASGVDGEEFLIFDAASGALRQRIPVQPAP